MQHLEGVLRPYPWGSRTLLAQLRGVDVPISEIKAKEAKVQNIANQLQSFAFQDAALKHLAQKAFVSYVRSIHLHKDKETFSVAKLPLTEFAAALGLPGAPKNKLVKDAQKAQRAEAARAHAAGGDAASSDASSDDGASDDDDSDD